MTQLRPLLITMYEHTVYFQFEAMPLEIFSYELCLKIMQRIERSIPKYIFLNLINISCEKWQHVYVIADNCFRDGSIEARLDRY